MEPPRKRQRRQEIITIDHVEKVTQASYGGQQPHHESTQSESTRVQNSGYGNVGAGRDFIINNSFEKPNDPQDHRQSLIESLRFDQIDARHLTIKKAYASTCRWFLQNPSYKQWQKKDPLQDDNHFLWIKGKPGAGKSTLMKFLHQQILKKGDGITISFFFNARGDDLEKSTIGLYRSLLLQLLEKRPDLQHLLDRFRYDLEWNAESLKTLFEEAIQGLGQTPLTCVIDAVDECAEQDVRDMVNFLSELVCTGNRLYICFASRHYPYISLETGFDVVLEEQDKHQEDIAIYLKGALRIGHGRLAEKIRAEAREKASGVFMWVVLVVDILNKESDAGRSFALRERLRQLPANLHDLFRDILTRDTNHQEALLLCIQWVLLAKRPLTPKELYFAILSGYEPQHLSNCHSDWISDGDIYKYILNNSKGLLDFTKSKKTTIQFIHESVRDFLLKAGGMNEIFPSAGSNVHGQGHEALKNCCMTYMNMDDAAETQELDREELQEKFPFLEYAIHGVLHHAEKAGGEGVSQSRFMTGFPRQEWIKWHNLLEVHKSRHYTHNASLLYVLAESNAAALIRAHPSRQFFDVEDERYGLPILAATATRSVAAVQTMLKLEGEMAPKFSWKYFQSLQQSSDDEFFSASTRSFNFSKRLGVMPQMLKYGSEGLSLFLHLADNDLAQSKDDNRKTLLEHAVEKGYTILLRELVQGEPKTRVANAFATDLLFRAMRQPDPEVIDLLIELGADVTSVDKNGRTPLYEAEHVAIAKKLIERGTQISITDQRGITPLHHAVERRNNGMVKLLIESGSSLSTTDDTGKTPLHSACQKALYNDGNRLKLVESLLKGGADILIADPEGKTPLHYACWTLGSTELVKSLIQHGSDVRAADHKGVTPLHLACGMVHGLKEARLLVKSGADVSAKDHEDRTPLHYASNNGEVNSRDIVKLLIAHGADVSTRDKKGQTPLHLVSLAATAKILIKSGADVTTVDHYGKTPLSFALLYGNSGVGQVLLKNGA